MALAAQIYIYRAKFSPVPAATKPVTMLIADFANGTGDPVFDGTIEPMLSIAMEGAPFITRHMIRKADKAFDDFAGSGTDMGLIRDVLDLHSASSAAILSHFGLDGARGSRMVEGGGASAARGSGGSHARGRVHRRA